MRFVKPLFDKYNYTPVQAAGGGGRFKKSPVEEGPNHRDGSRAW